MQDRSFHFEETEINRTIDYITRNLEEHHSIPISISEDKSIMKTENDRLSRIPLSSMWRVSQWKGDLFCLRYGHVPSFWFLSPPLSYHWFVSLMCTPVQSSVLIRRALSCVYAFYGALFNFPDGAGCTTNTCFYYYFLVMDYHLLILPMGGTAAPCLVHLLRI